MPALFLWERFWCPSLVSSARAGAKQKRDDIQVPAFAGMTSWIGANAGELKREGQRQRHVAAFADDSDPLDDLLDLVAMDFASSGLIQLALAALKAGP